MDIDIGREAGVANANGQNTSLGNSGNTPEARGNINNIKTLLGYFESNLNSISNETKKNAMVEFEKALLQEKEKNDRI